MKKSDVKGLFFICPVKNLVSICTKGILCHNKAKRFGPESVADPKIQERRERVVVPGLFKKLHDYANLYLNPRNAMMSKIRGSHEDLCIILVSAEILDEKDVLITDANASSEYVRFYEAPWGLAQLDAEYVFRRDWRHEDTFEYWRRKSRVCSEVLVPNKVPVAFIRKIFVSCSNTKQIVESLLNAQNISLKVSENPDLFFLQ